MQKYAVLKWLHPDPYIIYGSGSRRVNNIRIRIHNTAPNCANQIILHVLETRSLFRAKIIRFKGEIFCLCGIVTRETLVLRTACCHGLLPSLLRLEG